MIKRILTDDDLRDINRELDKLFQSGVESNKILVDALNSKNVAASTSDDIKTNVKKINNIHVGDYSIGDILKFEDIEPYKEIITNNPSRAWFKSLPEDGEDIAQDKDYVYALSGYDLIKFDKHTGSIKWKKTFSSRHTCVTADNSGNVYISGYLKAITKLNSNGSVVWEKEVGSKGYRHLKYYNGYIYGSGYSSLSKISTNGNVSWNKDNIGIEFGSLDVRDGYIYVIELNKGQVSKYSINGSKVWSKGSNDNICVESKNHLRVNSKNYIYVGIGEYGNGVIIYNSNGSKINQIDELFNSFDIDDDDILYIGVYDITAYSPNYNTIWKYDLPYTFDRANLILAGFNRDLYYIEKNKLNKLNIDGSQQVGYRIIK